MPSSITPSVQIVFDTTEDTARRGLFMFSSLIIIGWWLEINAAGIINKQLETNIQESRLAIVYLCILIYLTWFFLRSSQWTYFVGLFKAWRVRDLYTTWYKNSEMYEVSTNFTDVDATNINQNKDKYGFIKIDRHCDKDHGDITYVLVLPTRYEISDGTIRWIHEPSSYQTGSNKKLCATQHYLYCFFSLIKLAWLLRVYGVTYYSTILTTTAAYGILICKLVTS